MWSRIRPRCATLLGKSIAVAFSNSRSPREYEFATDTFRATIEPGRQRGRTIIAAEANFTNQYFVLVAKK